MSTQANPGRREFLRQTAGLSLAIGGLPALAGAAGPDFSIIDTHQHLWDVKHQKLAWLAGAPSLNRSFTPEDYREAIQGLNVTKAVYMEVDIDPSQQLDEARSVVEMIREGKGLTSAAVVSGRPASEEFQGYLAELKPMPEIKGMRQVLHGASTPPGYCLAPAFVRGIRQLGGAGLSFDLCMRSAELADGARLIDGCPETSFVLDHCGNADIRAKDLSAWKKAIAAIAKKDRVACKVSGIVASAKGKPWTIEDLAPIINHVLDTFGPDRVMFGGDWPVCTLGASYKQWVEALRAIVSGRPAADQRKLFHDNAIRVYRLNG